MHMKKMIKKIAALGAGIIMTGTTIGSALAVDLSDAYPNEFSSNTAIVIGTGATADSSAQGVINTDLAAVYDTGAVAGTLADEIDEDIPVGQDIADANIGFDWDLDDGDLAFLNDGSINFQSKDYDYREIIALGREASIASPSLETSLTSSDDDYLENVYLEVKRDSIKYFYKFDETINVSLATRSDPLIIDFLGQELQIYSVDLVTTTKFSAYTGEKHSLKGGESVVVDGYTVTLENVGASSAEVNVDGESQIINTGSSKTFASGKLEVAVSETLSKDLLEQSTAVMYIGKDAQQTYTDGDEYVEVDGNCNNDPSDTDCWHWDIGNLYENLATTLNSVNDTSGPKLAIENEFVINDFTDNPAGPGECYSLPNNFASICFDSLKNADDYLTLTIEQENVDLSSTGGVSSTETAGFHISVSAEESLVLDYAASGTGWNMTNGSDFNSDKRTEDVYLVNGATAIGVYYKDENNKMRYAGNIANMTGNSSDIAHIDWGDTQSTNLNISIQMNSTSGFYDTGINLTLDVNADSTNDMSDAVDDIRIWLGTGTTGDFDWLGANDNSEEGAELLFGTAFTNLGSKDENHRTRYGIIIEDPKANSASDTVVLKIPKDMVKATIKIGGAGATATTGPMLLEADEVTDKTAQNLILVGGPAINELTADFLGLTFPAYGEASGLVADEAMVSLKANGDNWAMIVAGWEADDTSRAANAVKDGLPTAQVGDTEIKI